MKLKLDENLGDLGRNLLMAQGHDMSTVTAHSMSDSPDVALDEACRSEQRVLATLDRDFGEVLRFPPEDSAGTAILDCRGPLSPGTILARIEELAVEQIAGRLWFVEPGRVRIREARARR